MLSDPGATLVRLVEEGETYLVLVPVYVLLLVGERAAHSLRTDRPWDDRDGATNIAITLAVLTLDVLVGAVLPVAVLALLHEHVSLFTLGFGPLGWAAAFLLFDLTWYVDHRIAHRVGLFWAMHHVHHSSNEFNTTVASRGFVFDNTLVPRPLFFALAVFGLTPLHYLVVKIVTSVWGIAQHTRLVGRLGWLEHVFATPSNHRVHHGSDPKYLDRNYGEVLILWDRLFGSYQVEEEEPTYGVTEPIHTYNPLLIEIAGFQWLRRKIGRARGWRDKLRCLYMPPDWEPTRRTGVPARPPEAASLCARRASS